MAISATEARLRVALGIAGVIALALFVDWALARQTADPSPQSRVNEHFANKPSLATALDTYPKVWPPLYPSLLWLARRVGIEPARVNQLCLYASLGLFGLLAVRTVGGTWPFALLALAVANFNYVNGHQLTPEVLAIAVLLGLLIALDRYRHAPTARGVVVIALLSSALFLCRYFALFFALPLVALEVFLASGPARIRRLAVFAAIALAPVALWMAFAFAQTGHITGADRFEARDLREEIQDWPELTTLPNNLRLFARTHLVDFFSTNSYASHSVIDHPYTPAPLEWTLVALAAVAALVSVQPIAARLSAGGLLASPLWLPLACLASYELMLVVIWSLGNNDPLYTRFLYPSYPLLLLATFGVYGLVKRTLPWPARLPFQALCAGFIGVHLWRDWQAVALPLR